MQVVRRKWHLSDVDRNLDTVTRIRHDQEVAPQDVGISVSGAGRIWRATQELYKTGTHPAISLCVRRQGQILFNRSLGHASGNGPQDGREVPKRVMTPDTPVCLFSASKAVTALLMHKLAELGHVSLMDPVSDYLPEFAKHGKRSITIHQILSHRGGIPGLAPNTPIATLFDTDEVWRLLCEARPICVDGSTLAYHAITGGFVLQRVLEKVTGDSIQNFLDRYIRQPMGMRYFTFGLDAAQVEEAADNYFSGPRPPFPLSHLVNRALGASFEVAAQVSNGPHWHQAVIPAANIYGTAEEAGRFFQMMLNEGEWNGQQLFQPKTIRRAVEEYGRMQLDRTLCIPMRYSAGFMLGANPVGMWGINTERAFGHVGLINKLCWADPDRQLSVSVLTTGIPLVSHHVPRLVQLVHEISRTCKPGHAGLPRRLVG